MIALIRYAQIIILTFLPALAKAEKEFSPSIILKSPGAELFHHDGKKIDRNDIVAGPIDYINDIENIELEGYLPRKSHTVTGAIETYVFDHGRAESTLSIFNWYQMLLRNHSFDTIFSCEGLECGDVAGWRLYLSELIEGDHEKQKYIVGSLYESSGALWVVVMHVNEFSGRPRSVVQYIYNSKPRSSEYSALGYKKIGAVIKSFLSLGPILFDSDSHALNDEGITVLNEFAESLNSNQAVSLEVVGHTDSTGSDSYNKELSLRRANSVHEYLMTQHKNRFSSIQVKGSGESLPISSNMTAEGRMQNRRVVLHVKSQ